jgi:hypothetical protein
MLAARELTSQHETENPSNTGTVCVTLSPESSTIPVVRPEEYLTKDHPVQSRTEVDWLAGECVRLAYSQAVRMEISNGSAFLKQARVIYV